MSTVPFTAQPESVRELVFAGSACDSTVGTPPLSTASGTSVPTAISAVTITTLAATTLSFLNAYPIPHVGGADRSVLEKKGFVP